MSRGLLVPRVAGAVVDAGDDVGRSQGGEVRVQADLRTGCAPSGWQGDGFRDGGQAGDAGAVMAGRAVGGVFPAHRQPDDDGCVAAADDQGVAGGELADHVGGEDGVAGVVVLAGFAGGGGAAEGGGGLQGGGVADAGEPDFGAGGVHDDAGAVDAPAVAELGFAVGDGDDLDALAAGVGEPGRQGDGADLGDFVQGHEQGWVEAAAGHLAAEQGGGVVQFAGQAGEQWRDGGVFAA